MVKSMLKVGKVVLAVRMQQLALTNLTVPQVMPFPAFPPSMVQHCIIRVLVNGLNTPVVTRRSTIK